MSSTWIRRENMRIGGARALETDPDRDTIVSKTKNKSGSIAQDFANLQHKPSINWLQSSLIEHICNIINNERELLLIDVDKELNPMLKRGMTDKDRNTTILPEKQRAATESFPSFIVGSWLRSACISPWPYPESREQQWPECGRLHRESDAATSSSNIENATLQHLSQFFNYHALSPFSSRGTETNFEQSMPRKSYMRTLRQQERKLRPQSCSALTTL
jgi:hypothetical protein